ncbi:anaerobic ribonucleoside-triphosphate reductase activating protein [Candidatus Woesearchaeota archaeon]|nr:anaerobic ribonucleoside-triphosphate reductase activating protein [Candidatus Woesearchaeota archaeon]
MMIKGLQKSSLIDYPPYVSVVVFTSGCNFRCGFCHNPGLVNGEGEDISEEEVFELLDKRKKWIDAVVITGGEPCLQKDLVEFISKVRERGFKVKLDTNGSFPDVLEDIIKRRLVDYIAMDIKSSPENYSKSAGVDIDIEKIKKSIDMIRKSGVEYEFRTTVIPGLTGLKEVVSISKMIKGADKYVIQNFRNSEDMIDNRFKEVDPFSKEELLDMEKAVKDKFEKIEIRD